MVTGERLLRKGILGMFSGGGPFAIHSSWLLVCAYGVVQGVDTLLTDVRAPRRREV